MLIKRKEARRQGLIKYFTGNQCIRGHISERYVTTGNCIECSAFAAKGKKYTPKFGLMQRKSERLNNDNKEKYLARRAVENAVRYNKIIKQPCERCGETSRVHAHHENYSKPLDIVWLCPKHHTERHREILIEMQQSKKEK